MNEADAQWREILLSPGIFPDSGSPFERALVRQRMATLAATRFKRSGSVGERLRQLQYVSQSTRDLSDVMLLALAAENLQDEDPRIRGEMCYGLGMSERASFIPLLQPLVKDPNTWVREQAENAVRRLEGVSLKGFIEEIKELRKEVREAIAQDELPSDDYTRQVYEEAQRNREAYERQQPGLLEKYPGQFVAFCEGELVAVGPDRKQVTLEAMQAKPMSRPYVHRVGEDISSRPLGRRQ